MKKGSDLLVEALENEGVDRVFGVPGEENLDVVESLRKSKIELVLTRHEQAAAFMAANPRLLDSKIMLSHYSAEVLFSPGARQAFVQPDIQSIPEHE